MSRFYVFNHRIVIVLLHPYYLLPVPSENAEWCVWCNSRCQPARKRPGSCVATSAMATEGLESTGSILEVVETPVDSIITGLTSTSTIPVISARLVWGISTNIPICRCTAALQSTWTNFGPWCPNRHARSTLIARTKHQSSTSPALVSSRFWARELFPSNQSLSRLDSFPAKPRRKSRLSVAPVFWLLSNFVNNKK